MCEHISASITGLANDPQTFKAFVQQQAAYDAFERLPCERVDVVFADEQRLPQSLK
jgi:hypothetical protein